MSKILCSPTMDLRITTAFQMDDQDDPEIVSSIDDKIEIDSVAVDGIDTTRGIDLNDIAKIEYKMEAIKLLSKCNPKPVIAVDLDYTMWPANCFEHTQPPYSQISHSMHSSTGVDQLLSANHSSIQCLDARSRSRRILHLYDEVRSILNFCREQKLELTIVSKSPSMQLVEQILEAFNMKDWFIFPQVFHARSKSYHFRNLTEATGKNMRDFLFFDDDPSNISTCSRIGVNCCLVNKNTGLNWMTFIEGLNLFATKQMSRKSFQLWLHSNTTPTHGLSTSSVNNNSSNELVRSSSNSNKITAYFDKSPVQNNNNDRKTIFSGLSINTKLDNVNSVSSDSIIYNVNSNDGFLNDNPALSMSYKSDVIQKLTMPSIDVNQMQFPINLSIKTDFSESIESNNNNNSTNNRRGGLRTSRHYRPSSDHTTLEALRSMNIPSITTIGSAPLDCTSSESHLSDITTMGMTRVDDKDLEVIVIDDDDSSNNNNYNNSKNNSNNNSYLHRGNFNNMNMVINNSLSDDDHEEMIEVIEIL